MKKLPILLFIFLALATASSLAVAADTVIPITPENLSQLQGKWEGTREVTTGIYAGSTTYLTVLIIKGQAGELILYDIPNTGILSYRFSNIEIQDDGKVFIKYEGSRNWIRLALLAPDKKGRLGLEGPWEGSWVSGVMKLRKKK